jgi:hypothetical protein
MVRPEDCREYAKRCIEMANNFADEKLQSLLWLTTGTRSRQSWNYTLAHGRNLRTY